MNIKEETNNALVYLSHWWGLHKPGYAGIAIKQDGTVIQFVNDFQAGDKIMKVGTLNQEDLDSIKKYLIDEENILESVYAEPGVFDAGTTIEVNIDGKTRKIKNESSSYSSDREERIYDRLLKKITNMVFSKFINKAKEIFNDNENEYSAKEFIEGKAVLVWQPGKRGPASVIIDKNDLSYLVVLSNTAPETVKQDFIDGKRS